MHLIMSEAVHLVETYFVSIYNLWRNVEEL